MDGAPVGEDDHGFAVRVSASDVVQADLGVAEEEREPCGEDDVRGRRVLAGGRERAGAGRGKAPRVRRDEGGADILAVAMGAQLVRDPPVRYRGEQPIDLGPVLRESIADQHDAVRRDPRGGVSAVGQHVESVADLENVRRRLRGPDFRSGLVSRDGLRRVGAGRVRARPVGGRHLRPRLGDAGDSRRDRRGGIRFRRVVLLRRGHADPRRRDQHREEKRPARHLAPAIRPRRA